MAVDVSVRVGAFGHNLHLIMFLLVVEPMARQGTVRRV
jgi:hypothetical protein